MLDLVESIVLNSNLILEIINAVSLLWILVWTRRAGSRIVEAIAMRLGLRSGRGGKIASPLERLTDIVDRYLPKQVGASAEGPIEEQAIEIEGLGSFKPSEIQNLAKRYLPQLKKAATLEPDLGGDLDIVRRIATGQPVGWQDALPAILSFLKESPQGQQAAPQQGGVPGTSWDS